MVVHTTLPTAYTGTRYDPKVEPDAAKVEAFYKDKDTGLDIQDKQLREAIIQEFPSLSDYAHMLDEDLDQLASSLATSTRNRSGNPTQSFRLSIRTKKRLKVLTKAITYCSRVQRDITEGVINWKNLQGFAVEYEALEKAAAADAPEVPKYNKNRGWMDHMNNMLKFFHLVHGVQLAPLAYLIIPDDQRDETKPGDADYEEFLTGKLYSSKHPRISAELLARCSRTTADAEADALRLYTYLAASLTGTPAESLLDGFSKSHDGVGLWKRIAETQLTPSAYEACCKKHLSYLMKSEWNGSQDGPLEAFVNKQRHQYELYEAAARQSNSQLYDDVTRVGWLLDGVKSTDPNIIVRKQSIRDDNTGKRVNFEQAAVYLATCEYAGKSEAGSRKRKKSPDKEADISSVNGGGGGSGVESDSYQNKLNLHGGRGKTGVELRWYPKPDFDKLPKKQKKELLQWRATNGLSVKAQRQAKKAKKGKGNLSNADAKKAISDIAAAAAALPEGEQRTKIESILSSVGAEVGSVSLDAPTGEDVKPNDGQSNVENVAEVGGSAVAAGEEGSNVGDDVRKDVEEQVAIAAALGTQKMVKYKSTGGGEGKED